jgi:hypothetical protein
MLFHSNLKTHVIERIRAQSLEQSSRVQGDGGQGEVAVP